MNIKRPDDGDETREPPSVSIEHFHYTGNDLTELRKLAEVNPDLANEVVRQRDRTNQRDHTSERLGVITAFFLGLCVLSVILLLIFYGGFWKLIIGTLLVVVLTALIRTLMTGEWSDTSWTGAILKRIAEVFGGLPPEDKN